MKRHFFGTQCAPAVLLVDPGVVPADHKVKQHQDLHAEEERGARARHPPCTARSSAAVPHRSARRGGGIHKAGDPLHAAQQPPPSGVTPQVNLMPNWQGA